MAVNPLVVAGEVADAISGGRAVVALESTLICHGLPADRRRPVAREIEQTVRAHGAIPATVGVLDGSLVVGLTGEQIERLIRTHDVAKLSLRDLAVAIAKRTDGATTVASTAAAAARAGVGVFATGGLGGVHRGARDSWDESADLATLGRTEITVVCSGVKSILDVPATLERLESLSVAVLGYRTDRFAGFYQSDSGHPVPWRVDSPEGVAAVMRARQLLDLPPAALVVAQPVRDEDQLAPDVHQRVLDGALAEASRAGIGGKDVTPFLLEHFHRETGGRSVEVNVSIILRNAALAADIAVAAAGP
ncbi:MAG: pseudouridine-5'-phosphate glycosidase [Actinomycetota bacterium]|nr:pseudouridine-5'-phosphate glycosidase [Actinomycetota bacterium]